MKIRKATKKDLPALVSLSQKLQVYERKFNKELKPNVEKETEKIFKKDFENKKAIFLIAEDENKPIGYCYGEVKEAHPYYKHKKEGLLGDCFVEEKYRGKGVGKELTNEILEWFTKQGIEIVKLNTLEENPSKQIWEKLGFKPTGCQMEYHLPKKKYKKSF